MWLQDIVETGWDFWYYFIVYAVWFFWLLDLIQKKSVLSSIKSGLGKDYKTVPDLTKMKKWRRFMVWGLLFTAIAMLVMGLIQEMNFILAVPVLIISGIVYLNGKFKQNVFEFYSTLFHSDKGFTVYPGKFKLFGRNIYLWSNVSKYVVKTRGSDSDIHIHLKEEDNYIVVRAKNKFIDSYKSVLDNYVIENHG